MAQNTRRSTTGRSRTPRRGSTPSITWGIPWNNFNLIGLAVGVGLILIGYLVMASGIADDPVTDKSVWNNASAVVIAPWILTIAYCVIVPIAIFWRRGKQQEESTEMTEA